MKVAVEAPEGSVEVKVYACRHCGQPCDDVLWLDDQPFCCYGCETVFEILSENNLCEYYSLDKNAGVSLNSTFRDDFTYLDDAKVAKSILVFSSESYSTAEFHIPAIHCVSCIWLLENLQRINPGVISAEVNFPKKCVSVNFNPGEIRLSELAALLATLGYRPEIMLEKERKNQFIDKSLVLKLAIAGFCFGNVMLFSFPEYLGLNSDDGNLMRLFSWLNIGLSIPVFFFSASGYFTSSIKSFQQRQINIDVPIALGLIALFVRSIYDIITHTGPGYLDSFTGLVFFLLIGRWFQSKTYESLSFDRDFRSYFPLSVHSWVDSDWKSTFVYDLKIGDRIRIRNMEIVPADSELISEKTYIDYSFVTGESRPVQVKQNDLVYAGGRVVGTPIELQVENEVSQSRLTSLWNHAAFKKVVNNKYQKIIDRAARKFTWIVLGIAVVTAIYWQVYQPNQMWLVLTSVLMVACPCALALAAPFTFGSMLRVFGQRELYLKNADVIERLANIDAVVFDKTGTVTAGNDPEIRIVGSFTADELSAIKALTAASAHPLSMLVSRSIHSSVKKEVIDFAEINGKGISGLVNGHLYRIGSAPYTGSKDLPAAASSRVFVSIDDLPCGYFDISISLRKGVDMMLKRLPTDSITLLSGDSENDRARMRRIFPSGSQLLFRQEPQDKMEYIRSLQRAGYQVLMVGDGLNDAGALKQSDVGIAVSDDTGHFSPACDGILAGNRVSSLDQVIAFAKASGPILKTGFAISFFYNAIALAFAVSGNLSPLVAAIIMPISSISVVSFSSLAVKMASIRYKF